MSENESDSIEHQLLTARHEKGVELSDVHRATGVSPSVLAGLESGAFDVVEPVFTRLALSAYVDFLGLDKPAILRQYDERCGAVSKRVQVNAVQPSAQRAPRVERALDMGALRVVAVAAGALVLLLLVIALMDDEGDREALAAAQSERGAVPAATTARPPTSAVPSGPLAQTERDRSRSIARVDKAPESAADAEVQMAVESESAELVAEAAIATEEAPVSEEEDTTEEAPSVGVAVAAEAEGTAQAVRLPGDEAALVPAALEARDGSAGVSDERVAVANELQAAAGGELVLEIEAIDSTWVQVKWDESGLFDAIVAPGSVHRWEASDAFIVHSGRAHGLRYTFQGELLGKGALGEATKVLRFRADASGVILLDRDFRPLLSNAQP